MDRNFLFGAQNTFCDRQGPRQRSLCPGSVPGPVVNVGQKESHSPVSLGNV